MNMLAALLIADRNWIPLAVGLIVLAAAVLWQGYRRLSLFGAHRRWAALLKLVAFAVLAACLVNPLWSGMRAVPGANLFVLLADNSRSMQIRDADGSRPRSDVLARLLNEDNTDPERSWQSRLAQDFTVRRQIVDSRLHDVEHFTELTFDGEGTSLKAALDAVRARFRNQPLAGVAVFTDGNATDLATTEIDTRGLPPIYPVLVGGEVDVRDVALKHVAITTSVFEDAPVAVQATVQLHGQTEASLTAQILDEAGTEVERKQFTAKADDAASTVRFDLKPTRPGVSFYQLRIRHTDEVAAEPAADAAHPDAAHPDAAAPHSTREVTLANNDRWLPVDRGAGPFRILYVSGRPNWEFKFLRRSLAADDQVDLVGLIRIAKREAKFEFRGRADENTNPIFRGFKKESDAETERYDQPVLIRMNTKDDAELRDGFPTTEEELYPYSAVILDDLEAEFFTAGQLALLERFVSERGGGLLMLGGQESLHEGKYARTPIGRMLPIYIDQPPVAPPGEDYQLKLTREGWLQPWLRLRDNEADEQKRLAEMPRFLTLNRVDRIKPGAIVLASAVDRSGKALPALVAQRFGRGQTAALTLGDLWRWQLRREDPEQDDLGKAWRQLTRWLISNVPERIDAKVLPAPQIADTAVKLSVEARDPLFNPLDGGTVKVSVKAGSGPAIELDAEPSLEHPGVYEVVFVPQQSGPHRATITVFDAEGREIGKREAGWASNPAGREFETVAVNRRFAEQLAARTGGEVIEQNELHDFATSLPSRKMPLSEFWSDPLWDRPWVFLLLLGCLIGEWGLRRWKGLP